MNWIRLVGTGALAAMVTLLTTSAALSQGSEDSVCVKIKLEIAQKLTFEADGFLAKLVLTNSQSVAPIEDLFVDLDIRDLEGNDASDSFFVKVQSLDGASSVDGNGLIQPDSQGTTNWLIIPTVGAGGEEPTGRNYGVRATIHYRLGTEEFDLETFEEIITVRPQPLIDLQYMLPPVIIGDNPFTPAVEPPAPYPLAVRVVNKGFGPAGEMKIETAQPEIVENVTGTPVGFEILGTFVDGEPVGESMIVDLGNIDPSSCSVGAWVMQTTIQGTFTSFDVTVSHKEELGGEKTSKIDQAGTDFLLQLVQIDTPGKDDDFDFLVDFTASNDGLPDLIRESDCTDTDLSVITGLIGPETITPTNQIVTASAQPTVGWNYFTVEDPSAGTLEIQSVKRLTDGKVLHPRNAWRVPSIDTEAPILLAVLDFSDTGGINTTYEIRFEGAEADVAPPVTTLNPVGPSEGTNPTIAPKSTVFTLDATDDGVVASTFFRLDGGLQQEGDVFFFLDGGPHTVEFFSVDAAGNMESPKLASITTDALPPQIAVVSPAAGLTYDALAIIPVSIDLVDLDPDPTVTATLAPAAGGAAVPLTVGGTLDLTSVGPGTFVVTVEATDWFGQTATLTTAPFSVTNDSGFSIDGVSPNASEPGADRELVVSGTGFEAPLTVQVEDGIVAEVEVLSDTLARIQATMPDTVGTYDITVSRAALTAVLADGLEVADAQCELPCIDCSADLDCLEGDVCTADACVDGTCVHDELEDCCPPPGGCTPCPATTDVDGTGSINVADALCIVLISLWDLGGQVGPDPACAAGDPQLGNLNCDSSVDVADITLAIQSILGLPIDASLDANANQCVDSCDANVCGDAFCAGDESCVTCPIDCGACTGDCCAAHSGVGCDTLSTQQCVCDLRPLCCYSNSSWTAECVGLAAASCGAGCGE